MNPIKRRRVDSTDTSLSEIRELDRKIFYHNKVYFDSEGYFTFGLTDQESGLNADSKISFNKNEDLTITSFNLPADAVKFTNKQLDFWKKADAATEVPSNYEDIFLTFSPSVDLHTWIPNTDFTTSIESIGTEYNMELLTRYVLDRQIYEKYTTEYFVLNSATNLFYKKKLFDLKTCLNDNNNKLQFISEYAIGEPYANPDNKIYLHYDDNANSFIKISGVLASNPPAFIKAYKNTFDNFMIVNNQIKKVNLWEYVLQDADDIESTALPAITASDIKDMNEYEWIRGILNKFPQDCLLTTAGRSSTHLISLNSNNIEFEAGTFFTSIESGDCLKKSKIYKRNAFRIQLTRTKASDIATKYNVTNQVDLFQKDFGKDYAGDREMYEVTILNYFVFFFDNTSLLKKSSWLNGFFCHFPYYQQNVSTLDLQIVIPKYAEADMFRGDNYKTYWSGVQKTNNILNSDVTYNVDINYVKQIVPDNGVFEYDLITPINIDDFKYPLYDEMIVSDGTQPSRNNSNIPLIAYSPFGKVTVASEYQQRVNILAYFNINRNAADFIVENQSYTTAIDKKNPPKVEYFQSTNIGELNVNVRDYKGNAYTGSVTNGTYPGRAVTINKNFFKQIDTINMIKKKQNISFSQDLLITVPDGSTQEYAEINNTFIMELNNKKSINNNATVQLKNVSLPTKISNQDTPIIFIECRGFDGTELNIFKRSDVNEKAIYKKKNVLGVINLIDIPDWHTLRINDDRISVPLNSNTVEHYSDIFMLQSFFDLQNVKLFLIDEHGEEILYGDTTTKRPHFTLSVEYYDE